MLDLYVFIATIAVNIIVTVVFTWSKVVLGDPVISLQVLDANILRVKHCIYLVKTNQFRAIIVD
jgi:hypothetical protein